MTFRKLSTLVLVALLAVPAVGLAQQRGTAQPFTAGLEQRAHVTGLPDLDLEAAVAAVAAEIAAEVQEPGGLGLVEGTDYEFVPAGSAPAAPAVDSVLMTRAALDKVLDELATLRQTNAAQADVIESAQGLILQRDDLLEAINEKTQGERWYIRALQIGGGLVTGYLVGRESGDTVVLR